VQANAWRTISDVGRDDEGYVGEFTARAFQLLARTFLLNMTVDTKLNSLPRHHQVRAVVESTDCANFNSPFLKEEFFMISRRPVISSAAALAAGAAIGQTCQSARPNILFISVDDLNCFIEGFGSLYTGPIHTPNLTRLANMGLKFTRAYTPSAQCQPARSAILSGIAPWASGYVGGNERSKMDFSLANQFGGREVKSIVRRPKECGYRSFGGGKVFHEGFIRCEGVQPNPNFFDRSAFHWPRVAR
jgi:hypothetical protein